MTTTPPTTTWPDVLSGLVAGRDLEADRTRWAMAEILSGDATPAQIAGFAVALQAKGITQAELHGLVEAMLAEATALEVPGPALDIVGTGGDRARTVNISSMAAVVAAGAGITVVKHGNRAASSASGTADVFEVLGVRLDVPAERIGEVVARAGITFCFAPLFHPSLRHAAGPRRELGIRTPFNVLGPLTNPARPTASAIGCADVAMAPLMAGVFAARGDDALVFRGDDGLDEITVTTTTRIWDVHEGEVRSEVLDPASLGVERAPAEALRGGEPEHNAEVFRRVLAGEVSPVRDAVLLNAAAGIAVHTGHEGTLTDRLAAGLDRARTSIDSGAATAVLDRWVAATHDLA